MPMPQYVLIEFFSQQCFPYGSFI